MGKWNAGAENQCIDAVKTTFTKVRKQDSCPGVFVAPVLVVVPSEDVGAGCRQRTHRRRAASSEPKDGDVASGICRQRDHLSFNVDRPTSARMTAMIQNRMTMVDSAQPFSS